MRNLAKRWRSEATRSRSSRSPLTASRARPSMGPCLCIASRPRHNVFPGSTVTRQRPHAMPVSDPAFRKVFADSSPRANSRSSMRTTGASARLSVRPAAGVPVVLTQHDYSHVCATKRFVRGEEDCSGPAPVECLRCASSWHGPIDGPRCRLANASPAERGPGTWTRSSRSARSSRVNTRLPGRRPYAVIPNFIPDDLVLDEAITAIPKGRSCSSGT